MVKREVQKFNSYFGNDLVAIFVSTMWSKNAILRLLKKIISNSNKKISKLQFPRSHFNGITPPPPPQQEYK